MRAYLCQFCVAGFISRPHRTSYQILRMFPEPFPKNLPIRFLGRYGIGKGKGWGVRKVCFLVGAGSRRKVRLYTDRRDDLRVFVRVTRAAAVARFRRPEAGSAGEFVAARPALCSSLACLARLRLSNGLALPTLERAATTARREGLEGGPSEDKTKRGPRGHYATTEPRDARRPCAPKTLTAARHLCR